MTILDQIGAAMDQVLAAEELAGLVSLPHECAEWQAWERARQLLVEAARACAEAGAVGANRCHSWAVEAGYRECGICRKWKPEAEMVEEAAGYESKKGESSRSRWWRCANHTIQS